MVAAGGGGDFAAAFFKIDGCECRQGEARDDGEQRATRFKIPPRCPTQTGTNMEGLQGGVREHMVEGKRGRHEPVSGRFTWTRKLLPQSIKQVRGRGSTRTELNCFQIECNVLQQTLPIVLNVAPKRRGTTSPQKKAKSPILTLHDGGAERVSPTTTLTRRLGSLDNPTSRSNSPHSAEVCGHDRCTIPWEKAVARARRKTVQ